MMLCGAVTLIAISPLSSKLREKGKSATNAIDAIDSGTTAAVAQKMGRRWIGVEMGDHAYTHCKVRLDKVVAGQDPGGITKAQN